MKVKAQRAVNNSFLIICIDSNSFLAAKVIKKLIETEKMMRKLRKVNKIVYAVLSLKRSRSHCFCSAMVIFELSSSMASSALRKGLTSRWESI